MGGARRLGTVGKEGLHNRDWVVTVRGGESSAWNVVKSHSSWVAFLKGWRARAGGVPAGGGPAVGAHVSGSCGLPVGRRRRVRGVSGAKGKAGLQIKGEC